MYCTSSHLLGERNLRICREQLIGRNANLNFGMSMAGIAGLLIQTGFGGFGVRISANGEKGTSVTKYPCLFCFLGFWIPQGFSKMTRVHVLQEGALRLSALSGELAKLYADPAGGWKACSIDEGLVGVVLEGPPSGRAEWKARVKAVTSRMVTVLCGLCDEVGFDLRKVWAGDPAAVVDDTERDIGRVLTCATDMAIGRHDHRIFSTVSPDKPADFTPRGLSCGFVKVTKPLKPGQIVRLKDKRRTVEVEIVDDVRPDRTARKPLANFLGNE